MLTWYIIYKPHCSVKAAIYMWSSKKCLMAQSYTRCNYSGHCQTRGSKITSTGPRRFNRLEGLQKCKWIWKALLPLKPPDPSTPTGHSVLGVGVAGRIGLDLSPKQKNYFISIIPPTVRCSFNKEANIAWHFPSFLWIVYIKSSSLSLQRSSPVFHAF